MTSLIPDRLTHLLRRLDTLDLSARLDAIANEVLETGGTYPDRPTDAPDFAHVWVLDLHGIAATGPNEAAMIENWCCAAHAHLKTQKAA